MKEIILPAFQYFDLFLCSHIQLFIWQFSQMDKKKTKSKQTKKKQLNAKDIFMANQRNDVEQNSPENSQKGKITKTKWKIEQVPLNLLSGERAKKIIIKPGHPIEFQDVSRSDEQQASSYREIKSKKNLKYKGVIKAAGKIMALSDPRFYNEKQFQKDKKIHLEKIAQREKLKIQQEVGEDNMGGQGSLAKVKKEKPRDKIFCKCKKSFCRKKYCQCFENDKACTEMCSCMNCHNHQIDRQLEASNKSKESEIKNFCGCRKSHCLKNYCDCRNKKKFCSNLCACYQCHNRKDQIKKVKKGQSQEVQAEVSQQEIQNSQSQDSSNKQKEIFEVIEARDSSNGVNQFGPQESSSKREFFQQKKDKNIINLANKVKSQEKSILKTSKKQRVDNQIFESQGESSSEQLQIKGKTAKNISKFVNKQPTLQAQKRKKSPSSQNSQRKTRRLMKSAKISLESEQQQQEDDESSSQSYESSSQSQQNARKIKRKKPFAESKRVTRRSKVSISQSIRQKTSKKQRKIAKGQQKEKKN